MRSGRGELKKSEWKNGRKGREEEKRAMRREGRETKKAVRVQPTNGTIAQNAFVSSFGFTFPRLFREHHESHLFCVGGSKNKVVGSFLANGLYFSSSQSLGTIIRNKDLIGKTRSQLSYLNYGERNHAKTAIESLLPYAQIVHCDHRPPWSRSTCQATGLQWPCPDRT